MLTCINYEIWQLFFYYVGGIFCGNLKNDIQKWKIKRKKKEEKNNFWFQIKIKFGSTHFLSIGVTFEQNGMVMHHYYHLLSLKI